MHAWKKIEPRLCFIQINVFFFFIASIPLVHMDEQHSVITPITQTGLNKHRACTAEPLTSTLCFFLYIPLPLVLLTNPCADHRPVCIVQV